MSTYTIDNNNVLCGLDGRTITDEDGTPVVVKISDDGKSFVDSSGVIYARAEEPARQQPTGAEARQIPLPSIRSGAQLPGGTKNATNVTAERGNDLRSMRDALGGNSTRKSLVPLKMFAGKTYHKGSTAFEYGAIKHGIMHDLEPFLLKLLYNHGSSEDNQEVLESMLRALVADFYANGASDKREMSGTVTADDGAFVLDRQILKQTMDEFNVGSQHRRVARALAPVMVRLMQLDSKAFYPLLAARAKEMSVTIEDAVWLFDGADVLPDIPSHLKRMVVASRMQRLTMADLSSNNGTEDVERSYKDDYLQSVDRSEG